MKKWLGLLLVGLSLQAVANDMDDFCDSTAEFGGEVLELRHAGLGRDTALNLVSDVLKDTRGEERMVASELLNGVVNTVYDMDFDDLGSADAKEITALKALFVASMSKECKAAMH